MSRKWSQKSCKQKKIFSSLQPSAGVSEAEIRRLKKRNLFKQRNAKEGLKGALKKGSHKNSLWLKQNVERR